MFHSEYVKFVKDIRSLGVLHIVTKEGELNEENRLKLSKINQLKSAVGTIEKLKIEEEIEPEINDAEELLELINDKTETENHLIQEIAITEKKRANAIPWGDFNPETITKLKDAGYKLQYFVCEEKNWDDKWIDEYNIEIVYKESKDIYFVCINIGETEFSNPNVEDVEVKHPLSYYDNLILQYGNELSTTQEELNHIAKYASPVLKSHFEKLESELFFTKVIESGEKKAEDKIIILSGWIPVAKAEEFVSFLDSERIVYLSEKAKPEDNMPIKLHNGWFSRLFEPIGELYTLPNHMELDLTPFFAPFYMLFFGFCLGDAGYGVLIMLGTLFGLAKASEKVKPLLWLGFFLGLATTVMGIVGGTVFGIMLVDQEWAWLGAYKNFLEKVDLMVLALALGYFQVVFGMVLKAVNLSRLFGFRYSIAQIGWIIIVGITIPAYALGSEGFIDASLANNIALVSGIVGAIPALFYNSPDKNIFLNFGTGLWESYGMASGLLGDVLSYIRLFALGLSSAILGSVFNSLALDLSPDTIILRQISIVLILAFGHGINIFMALLGAFVHPLRLTFVEFYKNAGFSGGGKKYNPFTVN